MRQVPLATCCHCRLLESCFKVSKARAGKPPVAPADILNGMPPELEFVGPTGRATLREVKSSTPIIFTNASADLVGDGHRFYSWG